jgi:uncharacterized membrane protein YraQ (UPF0718 family)
MISSSAHSPAPANRFKLIGLALLAGLLLLAIGYQASNSGREYMLVLSVFATRFLGIFVEAAPFLLLGSITSGLIETFIKSDDIMRFLPRNRLGAAVGGAFLGLVLPVCECGVVPVARRLFSKGTPVSLGVAFLLAAPFMNPIVFASTYIAFGFGPVFIGRIVITILVAVIVAVVIGSCAKRTAVLKPISLGSGRDEDGHCDHEDPSTRAKLMSAMQIAGDEFFEMGRFLIFGSILAALMQTLAPQDSLLALGTGPILSVLFMQILAYVLSVCSTVDSFLALAFVNTFTTGAIVSFLSFGPMVDIKSTLMFTGVFRRRIVLYLILLPFVLNLLAGALINVLLGYL